MTDSYYDRRTQKNSDGTPLFCSDYDKAHEQDVSARLAALWNCNIRQFGRLCPVDYYAVRDGRMVGVLELKSRTHDSDKYPTVFLNCRKWLSLKLAEIGFGVPSLFVVRFTDSLRFIRLSDVDSSKIKIGGCRTMVKSNTDIEPVIEVPVSQMIVIDHRREHEK